jgi:hypothetical protein
MLLSTWCRLRAPAVEDAARQLPSAANLSARTWRSTVSGRTWSIRFAPVAHMRLAHQRGAEAASNTRERDEVAVLALGAAQACEASAQQTAIEKASSDLSE